MLHGSELGTALLTWWPTDSHLNEIFSPHFAVIGSAAEVSDANDIVQPEAGTLEKMLTAVPGPMRFIPTHKGHGLPGSEIEALPTRPGSMKNLADFPLTPQFTTPNHQEVLNL
ncbi:hypothetical protein MSSAC_1691 [Methanosarcina siciliae C2J]|uniref:Uncharacterized protein n=1 Tax=Methanosarcina siciliae C2J TaxID=1434118 RepID=A0A0E3LCX5_9EURY|nr:hypothetical protein [Methanosarcina siciliae]AKB36281.1 hypothetical protein MSSAC_1691 [Methanosarcina siciliae C2J]